MLWSGLEKQGKRKGRLCTCNVIKDMAMHAGTRMEEI